MKCISLLLVFVIISSCTTVDSNPVKPLDDTIFNTHVKNIQWDLVAIDSASRHIDKSAFKRFTLILQTDEIWVLSGGNYMHGNFTFHGDTLVLGGHGIMRLPEDSTIPFDHLEANPTVKMVADELTFISNGTTYHYRSNFKADVGNTYFTENVWSMTSSNDSNFSYFDSLKLYPELYLHADRTFVIYYENIGDWNHINDVSGVFGINDSGGIRFIPMGGFYASNGTNRDLFAITTMLRVTRYEYANQVLKLTNDTTGVYYNFQIDVQADTSK